MKIYYINLLLYFQNLLLYFFHLNIKERKNSDQTNRLQLSKNNTFVGTAGHHLYLITLIALIEESDGSNGRTMIIQRL